MGIAISDGAAEMRKGHVPTPEAEVFLRLAAEELAEYSAKQGVYPTKWSELDMTYVNGPYNINDADIRPPAHTGNLWRPKKSNYEFRLVTNLARNAFRIEALGPGGRVEYFIESGQDYPTKVDAASRKAPAQSR
jgi:hypothetical protein